MLYWAVIDTNNPFTSVEFTNIFDPGDFFGFDNLTVGTPSQVLENPSENPSENPTENQSTKSNKSTKSGKSTKNGSGELGFDGTSEGIIMSMSIGDMGSFSM